LAHAPKTWPCRNAGECDARFEKELSSIPVLHSGPASPMLFLRYEEHKSAAADGDEIGDTSMIQSDDRF
jgi:hypothetical protein